MLNLLQDKTAFFYVRNQKYLGGCSDQTVSVRLLYSRAESANIWPYLHDIINCRKRVLKPPGAAARKPPPLKLAGKSKASTGVVEPLSPSTKAAIKAAKEADAAELMAPTLRRSTMQRVEEAEKERQQAENMASCFLNFGMICKELLFPPCYSAGDAVRLLFMDGLLAKDMLFPGPLASPFPLPTW